MGCVTTGPTIPATLPEQNKGFLAAILGGLLGSILFFFAILSYMVLHRFYDNAHKETRAVQ